MAHQRGNCALERREAVIELLHQALGLGACE